MGVGAVQMSYLMKYLPVDAFFSSIEESYTAGQDTYYAATK